MSSIMPAIVALFGPIILAGLSDYSEIELEQHTRGAFLHKPTGYIVLHLEVVGLEYQHCSHKLTPDGIPNGADCEEGNTDNLGADAFVVFDPTIRAYNTVSEASDLLFEEGSARSLDYSEDTPLAKVTFSEVNDWELTRLTKRAPCPIRVDGKALYYGAPNAQTKLVETFRHSTLSENCFEAGAGWFVIRYYADHEIINGSSDGDSTGSKGWSYVVVDASKHDHEWQNTLGLRALKKKAYAEARTHFENALKSDPGYRHANYNLACTLSLEKKPFAAGKGHLDKLLADPALKKKYIRKIRKDSDLTHWRADPGFTAWLARYE